VLTHVSPFDVLPADIPWWTRQFSHWKAGNLNVTQATKGQLLPSSQIRAGAEYNIGGYLRGHTDHRSWTSQQPAERGNEHPFGEVLKKKVRSFENTGAGLRLPEPNLSGTHHPSPNLRPTYRAAGLMARLFEDYTG
jgi:hypothetical protein